MNGRNKPQRATQQCGKRFIAPTNFPLGTDRPRPDPCPAGMAPGGGDTAWGPTFSSSSPGSRASGSVAPCSAATLPSHQASAPHTADTLLAVPWFPMLSAYPHHPQAGLAAIQGRLQGSKHELHLLSFDVPACGRSGHQGHQGPLPLTPNTKNYYLT